MNRIFIRGEDLKLPPEAKNTGSFIKKVLKILNKNNWELSVLFCSNSYIKSLNERYRNKNEATDVLSFPMGFSREEIRAESEPEGPYMAGDIVISLDALEENTKFFGVSAEEELHRLLVHGILHLMGEDHTTNKTGEPMLLTQEKILALTKQTGAREKTK